MNELKAAAIAIVGAFVLLFVFLAASAPEPKSIAENCQAKFGYDPKAELQCEFMAYGTRALDQADRRKAERDAAIAEILARSK